MVDTSTGKSIPAYVSISPNFAKIIVDGTAVTVLLNISEKTIILKTNLLPGNGIMASEYAQSDASIICPAAPVTVRKTVLKTYRENGIAVSLNKLNIVTKFESVGFCTKILGGKRKSSSIGLNALFMMYINGISINIPITAIKRNITTFPALLLLNLVPECDISVFPPTAFVYLPILEINLPESLFAATVSRKSTVAIAHAMPNSYRTFA